MLLCRVREASPTEVFAVQVVGSVLALSLGRKLFPISVALNTAVPEQVLPSCHLRTCPRLRCCLFVKLGS